MKIQGLVLAAGLSSRCGTNKLLMPAEGSAIIERTVRTLIKANLAGITVVLGSCSEEIKKVLNGYSLQFIYNPDYKDGMSTSLQAGINAISQDPGIDAVLIMLGDMPLIRDNTVKDLMTAYQTKRPVIIVPRCQGQPGHPVIFDRTVFPAVNLISGDRGAREIINCRAEQVLFIDSNDPGILIDLDTREAINKYFPAT